MRESPRENSHLDSVLEGDISPPHPVAEISSVSISRAVTDARRGARCRARRDIPTLDGVSKSNVRPPHAVQDVGPVHEAGAIEQSDWSTGSDVCLREQSLADRADNGERPRDGIGEGEHLDGHHSALRGDVDATDARLLDGAHKLVVEARGVGQPRRNHESEASLGKSLYGVRGLLRRSATSATSATACAPSAPATPSD